MSYGYSKLSGRPLNIHASACWGLGVAFIFFSIGHVVEAQGMVEMLPPWVPLRLELVYITGVVELTVGLALFLPAFQVQAANMAIIIFIVFFPANVYAAMHSVGLGGHQWGPVYLLIRAPLQMILIAWAYYLCVKDPAS